MKIPLFEAPGTHDWCCRNLRICGTEDEHGTVRQDRFRPIFRQVIVVLLLLCFAFKLHVVHWKREFRENTKEERVKEWICSLPAAWNSWKCQQCSWESKQPLEVLIKWDEQSLDYYHPGVRQLYPSAAAEPRSSQEMERNHELIYPRAAQLGLGKPSQRAQILRERDQLGILERKEKGDLSNLVIRCFLPWISSTTGFGTHKRANSWRRFNNLGAETAEIPRIRKKNLERTSWTP